MISAAPTIDSRVDESNAGRRALSLVGAALLFNFVLCFVNTNILPVSTASVVGCEFVIIILTFFAGYSASSLYGVYFVILLVLYLVSLASARAVGSLGGLDVKIVRDFLIPVGFFWLGKTISLKDADRIIRWSVIAVLCIAFFEYFFLDVFLKYFSVLQYYISRGTVPDTEAAHLSAGGLMVSGIRPEGQGRQLLPWLLTGHRASSVFLEPSSLGNYGALVALWAVTRSRMEGTIWWGLILAGVCCIVLADTRFAMSFLAVGIVMIFLPVSPGMMLAAAMPLAALGLLTIVGPADLAANDTMGRLRYASFVLNEFDVANWMGLADSRLQTFDAGYGYLFSGLGIFGVAALWSCYMSLSGRNPYFYLLRNAIAAYLAILFLISQSQMTIKTACFPWLMLGALSVARIDKRPRGLLKPAVIWPPARTSLTR